MKKIFNLFLILFMVNILSACEEKKEASSLSYLSLIKKQKEETKMETKRTQIIKLSSSGSKTYVSLAFAKDSSIEKNESVLKGFYVLRFTLHESFSRSKTLGGGTFVLRFKDVGNGNLKIVNFLQQNNQANRFPKYSISDMDSIANPDIQNIIDLETKQCVLKNCPGVLKPLGAKKNIYHIQIIFNNAKDEIWGFDHGSVDPELKKIINLSHTGIELMFPGPNRKASAPTYNKETIGTL